MILMAWLIGKTFRYLILSIIVIQQVKNGLLDSGV